ncbi:MAG: aminodeoxychorismate/anthranilate synthase component II [Clostridiales bacterium]|nr:aminodeoxychorismate/anthranilate synthase component II [Clostridiales bacterium]
MTLIIDNYDSFTYNLYQMIGAIDPDIRAVRNDALTVGAIAELGPARLILSPGPGKPRAAGICEDAVRALAGRTPILGVCLGHQAICEAYGATVSHARSLMHGKPSDVTLDTSCPIFAGLPPVIRAARYHSLAVVPGTVPDCLAVTATADDGEIMAAAHREHAVYGVQFHPESILTPLGGRILRNFLEATI